MIENLKEQDNSEFKWLDENDVSHRTKKEYLQSEVLNFCGCGDPDSVMAYVGDFLQKLNDKDWGSYEDNPYMFLLYWADHKGFSEHGSTVRCSWLTDKGEELLSDIKWCLENE